MTNVATAITSGTTAHVLAVTVRLTTTPMLAMAADCTIPTSARCTPVRPDLDPSTSSISMLTAMQLSKLPAVAATTAATHVQGEVAACSVSSNRKTATPTNASPTNSAPLNSSLTGCWC